MNQQKSNFRWVVVSLLFIITVINYIDRSSIAYAISRIASEFHLSKNNIGLILGAFGLGYTVTTFLGGLCADHLGAKKTLFGSTFFWGIATLLTAIAPGFLMIFYARILLGLAEGPNFPGMTKALSGWLPEKERIQALSIALISVPLSLAISGPIVSQLILLVDWRGAYYLLTIMALIWLPFWWYFFKDKPQDAKQVNAHELIYIEQNATIQSLLSNDSKPWKVLLFNKTLMINNWAFFVFGFYLFFFMTWLPNYLEMTYHVHLAEIGLLTFIPWLTAAIMIWIVGFISDKLFQKYNNVRFSRSYPIFLSQLLSALCLIPILFSHSLTTSLIFITLAIGFAMSANGCYFAVNVDIAKERVGTALGIMEAIFALSGFIAPTITGYLVSITGHFKSVFLLMAVLGFSSFLLTFLFHNRTKRS